MKHIPTYLICVAVTIVAAFSSPAISAKPTHVVEADLAQAIDMKVGEVVVIDLAPDDGPVIEGRSQAVFSQIDNGRNGRRLIVHAMAPGWGSVRVANRVWTFTVADEEAGRLQSELASLLADAPELEVKVAGDAVVIDGTASAPSVVDRVEALVAASDGKAMSLVRYDDAARQQVLIRFDLVEVRRSRMDRLGIDWSEAGIIGTVARFSEALQSRPMTPANFEFMDGMGGPKIVLGGQDDNMRLRSSHALTVLNGAWDDYLFGGRLVIPVSTATSASVTEFEYGIGVRVRPVVEDGVVALELEVKVDQPMSLTGMPHFSSMRQNTRVRLAPGETLALAGVLERSRHRGGTGMPGLRQVPVLGAFFGSRAWRRGESDAVLLVTPTVIDGVAAGLVQEQLQQRVEDRYEEEGDKLW